MTDEQIVIEVAKLDGYKNVCCLEGGNIPFGEPDDDFNRDVELHKAHGQCGFPTVAHREQCLEYLTSRDAIVPVIEKVSKDWGPEKLESFHLEIAVLDTSLDGTTPLAFNVQRILLATPRQLCIALLKATGKYKEEPAIAQ